MSPYPASVGCITGTRGERLLEATTRVPQAASGDIDGRILKGRNDNGPRPQTSTDWLVWPALWPIVTVAWLVSVPFVLGYVAVGSLIEVIFGIRLRRRDDSDGPDPPG